MSQFRSSDWFGKSGKMGFLYRSWMKNQGMPADLFDGRPVIGICNTWSELTPCNAHLRDLAESVKRGVYEAGGFPVEFPIMSLGETLLKPTAMLFRNLASMDAEESIRGNPIDGVVLLTGCDKTTPSTMMGAASVGLPTIVVPGGPMLNGKFRGADIGSGTAVWKLTDDLKTGKITNDDYLAAESCMSRSAGHCMTMGTASTMACMVESLGMCLSGAAATPAVDSRKKVLAQLSGRRIVEMVKEDLTISKILTRAAFENAIKVNAAIGGSTNFLIHLTAIAGRVGVELNIDDFDKLGSRIPLLLNLMPSGKYLMEDFFYAGGLPVILKELSSELDMSTVTVTGKSHAENISSSSICYNKDVIADYLEPIIPEAGIAVLKGNLALNGAVIKPSAATPALMQHTGRAVVFETIEDYHARVDDPDLDIDETCVMVLKSVGPVGYPGMPEVGNMVLPKKLLDKGVTDMVRISDGRMSGTAYGTVVLHVSPESAIGGNLALVQNGDMISLDVPARRIDLLVDDAELDKRRLLWQKPAYHTDRGYVSMYQRHVQQADKGADLDFLVGNSGSVVTRDSH
ncbi:IlvD/Edd family dehydratase [Mucilaginibacter psychrotolerans]|uniref:Dihydroxy-acid dehydratase n=1 Tax=Mucilaginibacter psychrotolerans TaxID=1524096 RepID=A0A4Y8SFU4_9SPHI|nr:IlvD/Edd family dehydratase [Mucilaginibacter psychrotolerans]TFF37510.1 dihydroxy-acid dehydratase [Mucilaginibacter psychrotolerans]